MRQLKDHDLERLKKAPGSAAPEEILSLVAEVTVWRVILCGGQGHGWLSRLVTGGLRTAIDAHGPIVLDMIGSASKRVVSQIRAAVKSEVASS